MDSAKEKVVPLKKEPGSAGGVIPRAESAGSIKARRDIGWLALIVSFIAILGMGGVYYTLSSSQKDMAAQVQSAVTASNDANQALEGRVDDMQAQLDKLASLPGDVREMMLQDMVDDLASRAGALADKLGDNADAQTLQQLRDVLSKLRPTTAE
ncbi:hypothetical protein [Oceanidesulfovibrio marinus]|uniref:Uncharacterized protein n=1 Tax=Oceanidesulfovibrio marinus TaxID=370038 RepID=A0A6P1ZG23_9BACT|nr:hypothetical protein [Oceanidesulfovibrio marinus]QJT08409.1 hypothetical protein E8L03_05485 [Oceanidesulfovibrio marinus]TVM33121.1 hypothetical protein DQK91_13255 [Oceanidesulfovibrio marinus]